METQHRITTRRMMKSLLAGSIALCGLALLIALLVVMRGDPPVVLADPIPVEEGGAPKLALSIKTVTPTLANTGGGTKLTYVIEIRNTGAYTAEDTTLTDILPSGTTYNSDVDANVPFIGNLSGGQLTFDVGFDFTAIVSFSVNVLAATEGTVVNTAVISHPLIAEPVTVTAETVVTDYPILTIEKTSAPAKPGAGKTMVYTLTVTNQGQPTGPNYPITVTDEVPDYVAYADGGSELDGEVTWTRDVDLGFEQSTVFTFSVNVNSNVVSGTVIENHTYAVESERGIEAGELYTITVIDPIFKLYKYVWPDPPGSNREMTYTLVLLNQGSLATDLVITDVVPAGVEYRDGGLESGGVVSWSLPTLDTNESARFTYTVDITDVMEVPIVNDDYAVCSFEEVCQPGRVLTSIVKGPTFVVTATLDPVVKGAGGGTKPVTPTLTVHNIGPGNALSATALIQFGRISISNVDDLEAIPDKGTFYEGPDCGEKCNAYYWVGDLFISETVTILPTIDKGTRARSTIGGEEGTHYTATMVITDGLSNMDTEPVTGTVVGLITHNPNPIPYKSGPLVVAPGQLLTYTIRVWNSGYTVSTTPYLTDTVPPSTTVVYVSGTGVTLTLSDTTVVSWTLPALSTGEEVTRSFAVRVDRDLISGTQIVNSDYSVSWRNPAITTSVAISTNVGEPFTVTVQEVGLVDSYKEVEPMIVSPGPGHVLTYYLHIVNSSGIDLTGVQVYDYLPWEATTYQRDAVTSAGDVYSDIVSVWWTGDVDAYSSQVVTLTVEVDPEFQGVLTNTAVISHPFLAREVEVLAMAYVTDEPVLFITKSDFPDPVLKGDDLTYQIRVVNLGQQATDLVVTDTIPTDTTYVDASATANGQLVGSEVRWEFNVLEPGESRTFQFQVTVDGGTEIVNDRYAVRCAEGVVGIGAPVVTKVSSRGGGIYLPIVLKNYR